jgi:hypothetical protein
MIGCYRVGIESPIQSRDCSCTLKFPREVGRTYLTDDQIIIIGDRLINQFGTYYQTFWNCQHFVRLFILLLTGKRICELYISADPGGFFRMSDSFCESLEDLDAEYREIIEYLLVKRKGVQIQEVAEVQNDQKHVRRCQII